MEKVNDIVLTNNTAVSNNRKEKNNIYFKQNGSKSDTFNSSKNDKKNKKGVVAAIITGAVAVTITVIALAKHKKNPVDADEVKKVVSKKSSNSTKKTTARTTSPSSKTPNPTNISTEDSKKTICENIEKQEKTIEELKKKSTELDKKLAEETTKTQCQIDTDDFAIRLQKIIEEDKKRLAEIDKIIAETKRVREITNKFSTITTNSSNKGLTGIAGYEKQIDDLKGMYNTSKSPNIVILYGPKGTGKTTLANAFAQDSNKTISKISVELDAKENFKNFENAAIESLQNYSKNGKETILLVNELDTISDPKYNKKFAKLMNNFSDKYHCSLIATTNYPEKIAPEILKDTRTKTLALEPANAQDLSKILDKYLTGFEVKDLDTTKLANQMMQKSQNSMYSNSRIKNLIENYLEDNKNIGKVITQEDLSKYLTEISGDISADEIKLFEKQKSFLSKFN